MKYFTALPIKKWQANKNERKTRGLDKRGNLLVFIYLTKTFDINFLPVGYPCTSNRLQSPLYFVQSTAANEVDGYNWRTNFLLTRWCKRELIPWKITNHQEYMKIAMVPPKKECQGKQRKFSTMKKSRTTTYIFFTENLRSFEVVWLHRLTVTTPWKEGRRWVRWNGMNGNGRQGWIVNSGMKKRKMEFNEGNEIGLGGKERTKLTWQEKTGIRKLLKRSGSHLQGANIITSTDEWSAINESQVLSVRNCTFPGSLLQSGGGAGGAGFWGLGKETYTLKFFYSPFGHLP